MVIFDTSTAINPVTDPLGRSGGYRNTRGGIARGIELSSSVAATPSLQLTAGYTYTDARQATPLVVGIWRTYETPIHQYSASLTQRLTPRLTVYVAYVGSSSYLASISGRAFRFEGLNRAQLDINYRRPLSELRAVRFYAKMDNLINQTYFENGFRTPGFTVIGGWQFEF